MALECGANPLHAPFGPMHVDRVPPVFPVPVRRAECEETRAGRSLSSGMLYWQTLQASAPKGARSFERNLPRTFSPPPWVRPTECQSEAVDGISTLRVPEPGSTTSASIAGQAVSDF